jgi:hypothetical protein
MKRSLATTLALAVTGSLVTLAPAAARSASAEPGVGDPGPHTVARADAAAEREAAIPSEAPRVAGRYRWPVALQVADLWYYDNPPSTDVLARQFASVRVRQDVRYGTVNAWVILKGAPDQASNGKVVVWFGRSNPETNVCDAQAEHGVAWDTWGTSAPHVDRNGARMRLYDWPLPGARTTRWNCAFAETRSLDFGTVYDVRSNFLSQVLARPKLKVKAHGKRVKPRAWVRVPVKITNQKAALGKAPKVRLKWSGRGLTVRGNRKVGTIKPGKSARRVLRVRLDRRSKAVLKLVVKTGDIRKVKKVAIRPR